MEVLEREELCKKFIGVDVQTGAFGQKLQLYIFCQSSLFWVRNFSGSLLSIKSTAVFTRKLKEKKKKIRLIKKWQTVNTKKV